MYDRTSCLELIKSIAEDYFTKDANISTIYNEYKIRKYLYKFFDNAKLEGLGGET